MATGTEIEDLSRSIAEDVIEAAQRELGGYRTVNGKKRRSVATGNLKNSLNYSFTKRYNNPVLSFSASGKAGEYLRYVTEGRRKGAKMPPLEPIMEWMRIKPIRLKSKSGAFIKNTPEAFKAAAFNIARSISKKGIEPFSFYGNAIQSVLDKRGKEYEEASKKEIEFRLQLK